MTWKIHHGKAATALNFRGKGGMVRPLRKDELVISKVCEETVGSCPYCSEVLGRKAWRVNTTGQKTIEKLIAQVNAKKMLALHALEIMERTFEGGK